MILVKTLLFTILVPGTVLVAIPYLLFRDDAEGLSASPAGLRWLGLIPIAAGALIYFRCAWDFGRTGRGTPNPLDPPKTVVVNGLYRFVRNPMYLGALLVLLGEAELFGSPGLLLYALLIWMAWHLFVVLYEEPHLRNAFGEEYERYLKQVPRWLPRMRSRPPA